VRGDLAGTRVLLTRTEKDNEELGRPLEELGASVLSLPCIQIAPPENWEALAAALDSLSSYDWIVFTSRHSVRALFDRTRSHIDLPVGMKVAAVGRGTERELRARGVKVDLLPKHGSADDLALALESTGMEGRRILLPSGDIARPELAEGLKRAGAYVDAVIAYRTVKPRTFDRRILEGLRSGRVDVVVLASPSAAHNLLEAVGGAESLKGPRIVCIGETTAKAAEENGLPEVVRAENPSPEGIVEAVVTAWKGHSPHGE
jgi:uroporphyrinogen III methyltransferase / synthase